MPDLYSKSAESRQDLFSRIELSSVVQAAVDSCNGDLLQAAQLLERQAHNDAELSQAVTAPFLTRACWDLIRQYARTERRYIWQAPHADPQGQKGARVTHLAASNALTLLNMPLPITGLPRLGEALREQVEEAAIYYSTHAKDAIIKAKFLALIAQTLPKGKRVAEKFNEAQLVKLREKAEE